MFKKIILLSSLLIIFASSGIVAKVTLAQDTSNERVVNVVAADKPIKFTLKRIGEKIHSTWLSFFNPSKSGEYSSQLVSKRFDELSYIMQKDNSEAYLETTVSRYITYVGLLSEQLDQKKIDKSIIENTVKDHPILLGKMRDKFPSQTAQWLMLQQAADSASVLLSKSKSN